ncbi:MAG: helix-turn-helix transcriptional regulator, partial [Clostridiaceae bacterium]|nr:helix-turn-helix transcriptional regulator [Clostridiaceae bacterium]
MNKNVNKDNNELFMNRKEQIIEKAKILFYKNGYDNTSMRELSKATGLSV